MNKQQMVEKLLKLSDAYYNNNSIISDKAFDKLYDEFKLMFPNDPFLKTIGSPISSTSKWNKANHQIPMGSLNKVINEIEFNDWIRKTKINEFCISEKLDGISLGIEYDNGNLVRAITRGDGYLGEDITKNVKSMQNVKLQLQNFTGSVRGEIILKQKDFEQIINIQKQRNENPIKNLRNGASGLAKRYDGKYSEFLSVVYFDITGNYHTKNDKFKYLEQLGLPTSLIGNFDNNEVIRIYNKYESEKRASLDYEIDGIVIEANNIVEYENLGELNHRPKGSIAWKFSSIKKETNLLGIIWQLGKSGTLTPVAELEPIQVGGVTIRRASLHNLDNFKKLKLYKNCKVLIKRAGDVIPDIIKVTSKYNNEELFKPVSMCLVCNTPTKEDGKFLICPNKNCDGAKIGNIKKWINVTEMKSQGIGDKTIMKFYDLGLITDPADLYEIKESDIYNIEGFGNRSAEKFVEIVQSHKNLTLQNFVGGLNIHNFSRSMVTLLINANYDTLQKIVDITFDELIAIKGIEQKIADSFLNGIVEKKQLIQKLLNKGITIMKNIINGEKLKGLSFCFTGKVEVINENGDRYKRSMLESLVKDNGGIVSSVNSNLKYLVQADISSKSNKSVKAKNLGVKIITDKDFLMMLS